MCDDAFQASLRDATRSANHQPGVETPGYRRASLREEGGFAIWGLALRGGIRPATLWRLSTQLRFLLRSPWRFAAERHLMVARPFKAGKECPKWVSSRSDD